MPAVAAAAISLPKVLGRGASSPANLLDGRTRGRRGRWGREPSGWLGWGEVRGGVRLGEKGGEGGSSGGSPDIRAKKPFYIEKPSDLGRASWRHLKKGIPSKEPPKRPAAKRLQILPKDGLVCHSVGQTRKPEPNSFPSKVHGMKALYPHGIPKAVPVLDALFHSSRCLLWQAKAAERARSSIWSDPPKKSLIPVSLCAFS